MTAVRFIGTDAWEVPERARPQSWRPAAKEIPGLETRIIKVCQRRGAGSTVKAVVMDGNLECRRGCGMEVGVG
jgi:hypothetical protein